MKTIRKYLVSNKHMQLQLLFAQFLLSVVIADNNDSNTLEAAENSTQSALRNQIAGKFKQHFPFQTVQLYRRNCIVKIPIQMRVYFLEINCNVAI